MSEFVVGVVQMAMRSAISENVATAMDLIKEAADLGADLVVLPELFSSFYFCQDEDPKWFESAHQFPDDPLFAQLQTLARQKTIAIVASFFERQLTNYFNSATVIDADGELLGRYRKSHIPDSPGYKEKFYFTPGDSGFQVFQGRGPKIGMGICWDQWFPEQARALALAGAELIVYPSAIGSEPSDPNLDSRNHWRRVMQGHAGANLVPVAAANRIGTEIGQASQVRFYGSSFITDATGDIVADAQEASGVFLASLDFDATRCQRDAWGVFRDRRPDLYGILSTFGGPDHLTERRSQL